MASAFWSSVAGAGAREKGAASPPKSPSVAAEGVAAPKSPLVVEGVEVSAPKEKPPPAFPKASEPKLIFTGNETEGDVVNSGSLGQGWKRAVIR